MTTAFALLKAFAAAFSMSPWLRTTAFVLIAFSFGFVKGCNTGRSWAKAPEATKVVRPERKPILPWREAEAPQMPKVVESFTVPVAKPSATACVDYRQPAAKRPASYVRRGIFGRFR